MSYHHHNLLTLPLLLLLVTATTTTTTAASFRPKALVLPISKDSTTLQYTTTLTQRTPLIPVPVTLDLGAQFLWVDCDSGYSSSTYRPARCNSAQCSLANSKACGTCNAPPRPGCNNNTCGLFPENPFTNTATSGDLGSDTVQITSTDGSNPLDQVTVPNFLFVCGPTFLLKGLPNRVQGIAGLGRTKISLPFQFSAAFSFPKKFGICLPSSSNSNGVLFFGDGPYRFLLNVEASSSLTFTPLITNPNSTAAVSTEGEPSSEYFIGVTKFKINSKEVPVNTSLLSIINGIGGTKISTVNPYTVLETSIYNSLTNFFKNELKNVPTVAAVKPFQLCYKASSFSSTRVGPGVPQIDLVLQSDNVVWTLFGANSMLAVSDDVICLGFVDGGRDARTSVVIGAHQLEDNLLQFDLAKSRLGFSSSLLFRQMTCANFNFTTGV